MTVDTLFIYDTHENYKGILSNLNSSMCPFFKDNRYSRLDNSAETLEFITLLSHPSGVPDFVEEEGYIVFKDDDGEFVRYKIIKVEEDRIKRTKTILAVGSWIELTKEFVEPFSLTDLTAEQMLTKFLLNTRWEVGTVEYNGVKSLTTENMISVLDATQRIRTLFQLEPRFRIEIQNNKIVGRYCDLLKRRGKKYERRFEVKKDVLGMRRIVDSTELVTAMYGFGQQEEGSDVDAPLDFSGVQWRVIDGDPVDKPLGQKWVGNPDALSRYSADGKYTFGIHESTVQGDPYLLLQKTWEVLRRRSMPKLTYEVDLALLEGVGIGDTITIHDLVDEKKPMIVEARVLELEGPVSEDKKGKAILGNYRELQKVDITETLQDQLRKYATKVQLQREVEVLNLAVATAKQAAIDEANNQIALSELEAKAYADGIVTAEEERAILDAQNKLAESKLYSDTKKQEAISQANTYTDQQALAIGEEIDEVESQLNATKTYIDGAFADGLVNEAEAKAIEKYLNSLSVEKADVDAKYTEIYNHTDLTKTTIKEDLPNKKVAYDTAHTNLINSINTAIEDGKTTVEEKQDVDSKFAIYRTALANLTTVFEKALTSISQKQADTAKAEAKNDVQGGIVPLPTGALNGSISSQSNNIVGSAGETLVEGQGVVSVFNFRTDWEEAGYAKYSISGEIPIPVPIRFFIPNNFKIMSAIIMTESMSAMVFNEDGAGRGNSWPKWLKIYKAGSVDKTHIKAFRYSEYYVDYSLSDLLDITPEVWGDTSWNPKPPYFSGVDIQRKTGDIKSKINTGWNEFVVKTTDLPSEQNFGKLRHTVVIKGYQR